MSNFICQTIVTESRCMFIYFSAYVYWQHAATSRVISCLLYIYSSDELRTGRPRHFSADTIYLQRLTHWSTPSMRNYCHTARCAGYTLKIVQNIKYNAKTHLVLINLKGSRLNISAEDNSFQRYNGGSWTVTSFTSTEPVNPEQTFRAAPAAAPNKVRMNQKCKVVYYTVQTEVVFFFWCLLWLSPNRIPS